ncbi:MAG: Hpt domain-containing protein [Gammaproteobacteria bacterium]|nr:Hpt domain-containing protein [Gammaproteobacteria bacterium]
MADGGDALQQRLAALHADYLARLPGRLAELDSLLDALRSGHRDSLEPLQRQLHNLTGSAGSYGLDEISRLAREAEQTAARLGEQSTLDAADLEALSQRIRLLGEGVKGEE